MAEKTPKGRAQRRTWTFARTSRILLFWYTFVTLAFRCPSSPSDISDTSPWMCKPYFEVREQVDPYFRPYYDAYAAPYVDTYVTPYVETYVSPSIEKIYPYTNGLHSNVYVPFRKRAIATYNQYGSTQVTKVLEYCDREWEQKIKPHIDQYLGKAHNQYRLHLEPHIARVFLPAYPRLLQAQSLAISQYHGKVVPLYRRTIPYAQTTLDKGRHLVMTVGYPYGAWATNTVIGFVTRKIWPSIRVLYGQNVEPQLSKISVRLGSYWDAKRLEAAVVAIDNAPEVSTLSSKTISTTSSLSETVSTTSPLISVIDSVIPTQIETETATSASTVSPTPSESERLEEAETVGMIESILSMVTAAPHQTSEVSGDSVEAAIATPSTVPEKVTEDLKKWQTKFKLAADKGADDLSERVNQITKRQIEGQVRSVGEILVFQLEDASKDAIDGLKATINAAIRSLPEDASDDEKERSIDSVRGSIRSAGHTLKERAQDLRSWKARFDTNTDALVDAASRSTLNVIDGIRDLGLQEIGLRWASMDSVTYQDWAEYHNLKETFDEWREQVLKVATNHEGLVAAKNEANEIESRGMTVAEDAAKELARLKEVSTWKINALDSSDDFENKGLAGAAASLGHKIMDKITGGTVASTADSIVESLSSKGSETALAASSTISQAAAITAQPIYDDIIGSVPSVDEFTSLGSDTISSVSEAAATATDSIAKGFSTVSEYISDAVESILPSEGIQSSVSSLTDPAPPQPQSLVSTYTDISSSASSALSTATDVATVSPFSSVSSIINDASETILDPASLTSAIAPPASSLSSQVYAGVDALKDQFHFSIPPSSLGASIPTTTTENLASTASSVVMSVAGTVLSSGGVESASRDVVDSGMAASRSVQSLVSQAGEGWAEVTRGLGGGY